MNDKKTIRMPKKKLDKWLRALRSGSFQQGEGTLYSPADQTFCCLGVLQYVCSSGKVELEDGELEEFGSLPSMEWAEKHGISGVRDTNTPPNSWNPVLPSLCVAHQVCDAATLNDDGVSFLELADAIERHTETY